MRKVLSLMLTIALMLTVVAVPASAANIDLLDAGAAGVASINYNITATDGTAIDEAYVGDKIQLEVSATLPAGTYTDLEIPVKYDSAVLKYVSLTAEPGYEMGEGLDYVEDGIVKYTVTDKEIVSTGDAIKLFEVEFEVISGVGTTSTVAYDTDGFETSVIGDKWYSVSDNNITTNTDSILVKANTVKALVDGDAELQNETYYDTDGFTITVEGTNVTSATITLKGSEPVAIGDGYPVTAAGTYTVNLEAAGGVTKSYTFTLDTTQVTAKLVSSITSKNELGYKAGEGFKVPVAIELTEGKQAAMVTFDVAYDKTKLVLNTAALNVEGEAGNYTVKYGTEGAEVGLEDGENVAILPFAVADGAAVGLADVTFSKPQIALVTDGIDATDYELGVCADQSVTIVVDTFATAAFATEGQSWSNTQYDVTVKPVDGVTVGYMAYDAETEVITDTQAGLKAIYDAAVVANQVTNTITFDSEKTYYAVAKIEDVYQLVKLPDNMIDKTAPVVDADKAAALDMNAYANGVTGTTINVAGVATDANGITVTATGIDGITVEGTVITIPAGTYDAEITVTYTDAAGNTATDAVKVMLDNVAPTVVATVGEVKTDGTKDITVAITDNDASAVTAKWFYSATEEFTGEGEDVVDGVINAAKAGNYKVVVSDIAGSNETTVVVALDKLTAASGITVKTVKAGQFTEGFKTTEEMTELVRITDKAGAVLETNGWFTYVAIKALDAPTNYTNTLTLDGEAYTAETPVAIGEHVLVVKTAHNVDATDFKEATYKFSVVAALDMPSVNADKRYNVIDYALIRNVSASGANLPVAGMDFYGGLFSGDLDGDLDVDSTDLAAMLTSLKNGEKKGAYNSIPVMNYEAPVAD